MNTTTRKQLRGPEPRYNTIDQNLKKTKPLHEQSQDMLYNLGYPTQSVVWPEGGDVICNIQERN